MKLLTILLALALVPAVRADLINATVVTDTQFKFLGYVDYIGPLTADTIRFKPAAVDPLIPSDALTVNWVITVRQGRFDLVPPAAANDIQITATHQVPPHGEGVGNLLGPLEFSQGNLGAGVDTNPGATVRDAMGNVRILSTLRSHGEHQNFLQARMDGAAAGVSRISFQADHLGPNDVPEEVPEIPEPATNLLLAGGLSYLLHRGRLRRSVIP